MSEFFFNFIGFTLLGAVAIVLIMGIYTLFKGGNTSKKYSNKLMQLRVLLQFIAIIVLVLMAYFFKKLIYFFKIFNKSFIVKSISPTIFQTHFHFYLSIYLLEDLSFFKLFNAISKFWIKINI